MAEKNYGNNSQLGEIVKYISDNMKVPVLGVGGGYAPIGTRAYFDGTLAPEGWLLCDGSTHNITDYPELASYFASHHGSSNCYGGNGTTTFATPVMNGMPNGGVETPDEHIVGEWREEVDGVLKFKPIYRKKFELSSPITISNSSPTTLSDIDGSSIDRIFEGSSFTGTTDYNCPLMMIHDSGNQDVKALATRANNTISGKIIDFKYTKSTDSWQTVQEGHSSDGNGVFCIKATLSDTELENMHVYSPNEHQVGWWQEEVDSVLKQKPVYEKRIDFTSIQNIDITSLNVDIDRFFFVDISIKYKSRYLAPTYYSKSDDRFNAYIDTDDGIEILFESSSNVSSNFNVGHIVIRYAKTTDQWQTV